VSSVDVVGALVLFVLLSTLALSGRRR